MNIVSKCFAEYLSDESGATAIEYGLLAALIGVGIIGGAKAFADASNFLFGNVNSELVQVVDTPQVGG